jgi:hypothetical protein
VIHFATKYASSDSFYQFYERLTVWHNANMKTIKLALMTGSLLLGIAGVVYTITRMERAAAVFQ